jgi:hypothetical protein
VDAVKTPLTGAVIAVDFMNIDAHWDGDPWPNRGDNTFPSTDLIKKFCDDLLVFSSSVPIVFICDHINGDIPAHFKKNSDDRRWFAERRDLPEDDPRKIFITKRKSIKADYPLCELHNTYRALLVTRDALREEREGLAPRLRDAAELRRFAGFWLKTEASFQFIGQTRSCQNYLIENFLDFETEITHSKTARKEVIDVIRSSIQTLPQPSMFQRRKERKKAAEKERHAISVLPADISADDSATELVTEITGGLTFSLRDLDWSPIKRLIKKESSKVVVNVPPEENPIPAKVAEPIEVNTILARVNLFDQVAVAENANRRVVVVGVPYRDIANNQLLLSWFNSPVRFIVPDDVQRKIRQAFPVGALIEMECEYKHLDSFRYELTDVTSVRRVNLLDNYATPSSPPLTFSVWGVPRFFSHKFRPKAVGAIDSVISSNQPNKDVVTVAPKEKVVATPPQRDPKPYSIDFMPEDRAATEARLIDDKVSAKPSDQPNKDVVTVAPKEKVVATPPHSEPKPNLNNAKPEVPKDAGLKKINESPTATQRKFPTKLLLVVVAIRIIGVAVENLFP